MTSPAGTHVLVAAHIKGCQACGGRGREMHSSRGWGRRTQGGREAGGLLSTIARDYRLPDFSGSVQVTRPVASSTKTRNFLAATRPHVVHLRGPEAPGPSHDARDLAEGQPLVRGPRCARFSVGPVVGRQLAGLRVDASPNRHREQLAARHGLHLRQSTTPQPGHVVKPRRLRIQLELGLFRAHLAIVGLKTPTTQAGYG
jgi:hypothetical protein